MAKPSCDHPKDTHCIHSSERRSFRSCRLRWFWAYIEHMSPYSPIKPLEFGIAIHKGMEVFFDPDKWGKLSIEQKLQLALKAFDEENDKQQAKFIAQPFVDNDLNDYEERKQLGAGMLTYYARDIHPVYDTWFRPVRTEISFHVPLYNDNEEEVQCNNSPNCGQIHPNPAPCTLDGRLDVLVEDMKNGGYYIVDWKTAAQLLKSSKHLYLDDQISTYTAALSEELNVDIKGFLYIQLAKAYPQSPKQLKRRRSGCLYSVSKTQNTTYELAEQTFKVYDKEAYDNGLYEDFLNYLRSSDAPVFHQRFALRQNPTKSANALRNTAMEAADMTAENLLIYPAPGKFNCEKCAFFEPCVQKLNGEDYEYTLQSEFEAP